MYRLDVLVFFSITIPESIFVEGTRYRKQFTYSDSLVRPPKDLRQRNAEFVGASDGAHDFGTDFRFIIK